MQNFGMNIIETQHNDKTDLVPAIVVRNKPLQSYIEEFGIGQGQLKMIEDYRSLLAQKQILQDQLPKIYSSTKALRKMEKNFTKDIEFQLLDVILKIRQIEKHIDYSALLVSNLNSVSVIDEKTSWKTIKKIPGPFVVRAMASKNFINYAKEYGYDFIFLENGYFGNYKNLVNEKSKKQWQRICINELQQENILSVPDDRWKNLVDADNRLKWPGWKKNGSKILLVAPSRKPCEFYGQNVNRWKDETISQIKKFTDREIVIREKASRFDRTQTKTIYESLDDDIYCVVTYQSIAAVEAIAYGIPVFALAPSAARKLSLDDLSMIETPFYPDPDLVHKWCCSLAYGQFSISEIFDGTAWKMVLENKERETINC